MDLKEAERMALDLMTHHGVGHVRFEFNGGKKMLGVCHHYGLKDANGRMIRIPSKIELSKHYVQLLPKDEIRDVILHEIAHALALGKGERGHGYMWKTIARTIGAKPERCARPSAKPEASVKGQCPVCEKVVMEQHRLPLRVSWHRGCGDRHNVLTWFKNGRKMSVDEMPARYQNEYMRLIGF